MQIQFIHIMAWYQVWETIEQIWIWWWAYCTFFRWNGRPTGQSWPESQRNSIFMLPCCYIFTAVIGYFPKYFQLQREGPWSCWRTTCWPRSAWRRSPLATPSPFRPEMSRFSCSQFKAAFLVCGLKLFWKGERGGVQPGLHCKGDSQDRLGLPLPGCRATWTPGGLA